MIVCKVNWKGVKVEVGVIANRPEVKRFWQGEKDYGKGNKREADVLEKQKDSGQIQGRKDEAT